MADAPRHGRVPVTLKDTVSADSRDLFSSREECGPSAQCCAMP